MTDTTEKNRSHWDENASTYNTKFQKTIQQIIDEIQARKDWIGVDWVEDVSDSDDDSNTPKKQVKLLDYACGTGLVSRGLAPYVTQCVGIDLSSGMVSEYNKSVANQGIDPSEMRAVVGNLIPSNGEGPSESIAGPEFFDFDIAVVGLGFHHFDNPALAAKRLTERLKKGGVLMIIDFLPHAGHGGHSHSHGHSHGHGHHHGHEHGEKDESKDGYQKKVIETVTHNGFSEEDIRKMFEDAGASGGFDYAVIGKGIVFSKVVENGEDMKRSVFMARGTKL